MAKTTMLVKKAVEGKKLSVKETKVLRSTPISNLLSALRELGLSESKFLQACFEQK